MATTIDPALVALVAHKAIGALGPSIAPFRAFSTNFSDEVADVGSSVGVNVLGRATPVTSGTVDYTQTGGTVSHVSVSLNQRQYASADFTDIQLASLNDSTLEQLLKGQLREVLASAHSVALAALQTTEYTANASDAFTFNDLLAIRKQMSTLGLPTEGRSLLLSPDANTLLLGDETISRSFASRVVDTALGEGVVDRIAGFDCYEVSAISDCYGYAVVPSALAVASRYLPDDAADWCIGVRDEQSGLTFGIKMMSDSLRAKKYIATELIFGVAAVAASSDETRALKISAAA